VTAQIIQFQPKAARVAANEDEPDPEKLLTFILLRQIAINLGLDPIRPEKPRGA
jgi:hypothetical protein